MSVREQLNRLQIIYTEESRTKLCRTFIVDNLQINAKSHYTDVRQVFRSNRMHWKADSRQKYL